MVDSKLTIKLTPGEEVCYLNKHYRIRYAIDLTNILLQSTDDGQLTVAPIKDLSPIATSDGLKNIKDVSLYSNKEWEEAQRRFSIILPIIKEHLSTDDIKKLAKINKLNYVTLYRWISKYNETGTISSLIPNKKGPSVGYSKLSPEIDAIIKRIIDEEYLTSQRKSISNAFTKVAIQCKNAGLKAPHFNTFRNRILSISEERKIRLRYGEDAAKNRFDPLKGNFPGADFPLSIVQIDHTKVDIILVDEVHRKPLGRPWITLSIDVFSRMALGFYISFDPPGAMGTGMCISQSILPKDLLLSKFNIKGEWPCWGIMRKIHLDNAKEFRGDMLTRACAEYNIELDFRPVKTPNYGGHIERLMGTFLKDIHALPGTTFSNPKEKGNYDSEKHAAMTLHEFEEWFLTLVVESYHNKMHSSLGKTPLERFREGIFGSANQKGVGLAPRFYNERKLKLDFMPFVERTIQQYGVRIEFIYYYHDVLRKWIHSTEGKSMKSKLKRKFIFKIDPRDISVLFFYDPDLKEYFEIPYRNLSFPPITIWEYREVVRKLEQDGVKVNNEDVIFDAYRRMNEIAESAIKKTKDLRAFQKKKQKKKHSHEKSLRNEFSKSMNPNNQSEVSPRIDITKIKPFDDLVDEPFK